MRILILMDLQAATLADGQPPFVAYSHDKNLLQFAHEALRKNLVVLIGPIGGDPVSHTYWRARQVYPTLQRDSDALAFQDVRPDIVVGVFPDQLNIRRYFPHPKIVGIHAAIHWIESPERFSADYVLNLLRAVRYDIDFIVTQNPRMAEILTIVYEFFVRWPYRNRVLVAPLGIVDEESRAVVDRKTVRQEMALADDEVAIINAGGVWRWTDVNTFLRAFGRFSERGPSRLKCYLMGIIQPNNKDHYEYVAETFRILERYRDLVGDRITVYRDWNAAGGHVANFTAASDIGLNVNQSSLENWQSYRIRFLEYMMRGLPVIATGGDLMSGVQGARHAFIAEPGNQDSYEAILNIVNSNPEVLEEKAAAMRQLSEEFNSRNTYGRVIDHILRTPRREDGDHEAWGPSILELAQQQAIGQIRHRVVAQLDEIVSGFDRGIDPHRRETR